VPHERLPLFDDEGNANQELLEELSVSQLGQDLWVLKNYGYKAGGYFVEFGASDGIMLSNTYLLETVFGWRGICVEPNPDMYAKLRNNRTCVSSNACIGSTTGATVEFVLADEYGGISDTLFTDHLAARRRAYASVGKKIQLKTVSLDDLLHEQHAPRRIDYLSVDTEGSEYEILRTFPFENWDIGCITIEHNFSDSREAIFELLSGHGYERTEAEWDDWYLKLS
jgi:FkbM family methyltransferase